MSGASITVTVSIGRNVGTLPMLEHDWQAFAADTTRIVRNLSSTVHFLGFGSGEYEGETEESYTIVATTIVPSLQGMRDALALLARENGQEAIAVTSGMTRYVMA